MLEPIRYIMFHNVTSLSWLSFVTVFSSRTLNIKIKWYYGNMAQVTSKHSDSFPYRHVSIAQLIHSPYPFSWVSCGVSSKKTTKQKSSNFDYKEDQAGAAAVLLDNAPPLRTDEPAPEPGRANVYLAKALARAFLQLTF
jgi:hypothetical protein